MSQPLVLSLFPGIGLLDMAFEEEGFCVVRGPDVLWGGDIRRFHPPAGVFDGVIGGPPCQTFSPLARLVRSQGREVRFGNLIPEFERCVAAARPSWFLMENVPAAPAPVVPGFLLHDFVFNNRWTGAEQNRTRRLCFGSADGRRLHPEIALLESPLLYVTVTQEAVNNRRDRRQELRRRPNQAVTAAHSGNGRSRVVAPYTVTSSSAGKSAADGVLLQAMAGAVTSSDGAGKVRQVRYTLPEACRLQGLPEDFLSDAPFTAEGKLKAVANGVPLPMGRAIAQAVKRAMGYEMEASA